MILGAISMPAPCED